MTRKILFAALSLIVSMTAAPIGAHAQTIRIATEGAYPPFNHKNTTGELIGFDVDIAKALCAEMKVKCTIAAHDWDGIIPGLLAKKYDLIVASMSITDERKQKVAFSDPYYSNFLQFVARKGAGLTPTAAGLKGKTLGAQRSTVSSHYLEDKFRKTSRIKVYDKQTAAWLDLTSGRVDAVLADIYPAYDWLKANTDYEFIGKKIDINDKIGIAARKDDTALLAKVNAALKAIRANGTYARINARHFPFDIY